MGQVVPAISLSYSKRHTDFHWGGGGKGILQVSSMGFWNSVHQGNFNYILHLVYVKFLLIFLNVFVFMAGAQSLAEPVLSTDHSYNSGTTFPFHSDTLPIALEFLAWSSSCGKAELFQKGTCWVDWERLWKKGSFCNCFPVCSACPS